MRTQLTQAVTDGFDFICCTEKANKQQKIRESDIGSQRKGSQERLFFFIICYFPGYIILK